MDQLLCPLCGRRVSLRIFDPELLDDDIYAVTLEGLGRGRGFREVNRYSVSGDPDITGPIAARCREILRMIEGKVNQAKQEDLTGIALGWVNYARGLESQVASMKQELSMGGVSGARGGSSDSAWRRRAEEAEAEVARLRGVLDGLERRVRSGTNSNLSLGEGVEFLLER